MFGRVGQLGGIDGEELPSRNQNSEDLDERTRHQLKVILQYLQEKELLEALTALESETGVSYTDGDLPVFGVLEASLDMFKNHFECNDVLGKGQEDAGARAAEEAIQKLERGVCCTGPCSSCPGPADSLGANVTAVAWVATKFDELLSVVATADRRLRLLGGFGGEVLAEYADFSSPPLSVDVAKAAEPAGSRCQELLVTTMGGEAHLLQLERKLVQHQEEVYPSPAGQVEKWSIQARQLFRDHQKQVTSGRFAPASDEVGGSSHFVTASRDHKAQFYSRTDGKFCLIGTVAMQGEVTCCAWLGHTTCILAARDDHELHYWDMCSDGVSLPKESLRANLNALGDSIVSFTVLALAVSPNRSMVAACTDKCRVIVLQPFTSRQLRNLYGAVIGEYDMPSVCFSLDSSFLYVTSTLPHAGDQRLPADEDKPFTALVGQIAIFEVRKAQLVLQLACHEKAVRCLDRHPLSENLVTGSFDKRVKYWG
eukprot:TRINITY_DN14262_c0_g1_i1.p1 TRINITY_DN14262_c0_g1~~TRINITY_DN14262_c0_g1_i1.p1  ORF type:complete len:483 (+),score=94.86 TRINITY_DN14262_c0_g1_i1:146-1594(+)